MTLLENQLPLCAYCGVAYGLTPVHLHPTHTEHDKRGAIGLFYDHLRNGSWQSDTANFYEGVGQEPNMPGNGSSPFWQGRIHLALSPQGRRSAMLCPAQGWGSAVTAPLPPGPTRTWQAFRDISFIKAGLTQKATFTSLGKNPLASLITHFHGG